MTKKSDFDNTELSETKTGQPLMEASWIPTMNLRYVTRTVVQDENNSYTETVLQQQWENVSTRESEFRDIEHVKL
ncbi:MAG TPA: hypothetical protein PLU58_06595 [Saprospiraceae bacterium]|nr:hypothetical protein [Saprospiraceae bacterium]